MDLQKVQTRMIRDLEHQIPELTQKNIQITELPSKKNSVINVMFEKKPSKLPKEVVIKIFHTKNIAHEINILNRLKNQNFHVPRILFFQNPYLILEKVKGINLCDFINEKLKGKESLDELETNVKNEIIKSIEKLAEFLAQFHEKNFVRKRYKVKKKYVLCKGDTRLRDFIFNSEDGILYAVDFEDSYEGNHLDDLAWICTSLLDTDPGLFEMEEPKHKMELINIFLRNYYQNNIRFPFKFNYLAEKIIENLNIVIERRNLPFGTVSKDKFIENISKEI
ncbi:MAG: lipopolysaccharide kinase InaA family protein [Candidatus Lokiarchaeia archaeon]|nr:lipopolysaccharide kinase InaA family protein [Candidatus Lokiarchaeia archaeon]